MTGAEAMNRLLGRRAEDSESKNPVGRPPGASATLHTNPDDPRLTNIVLQRLDDPCSWVAGSVLQILWPNGEVRSVVLAHDLEVIPLDVDLPDVTEEE